MEGNPPQGPQQGVAAAAGGVPATTGTRGQRGGTQPAAAPCAPSARRPLPKSLQEQPGSGAFGCLSLWKPLLIVLGHG